MKVPGGFLHFPFRCQSRRHEGHVGGLSRKTKTRKETVREPREAEIETDLEEMEVAAETRSRIVERQEVCNEETIVDNVVTLKDRYEDRRLAIRRRRQLKTRSQGGRWWVPT